MSSGPSIPATIDEPPFIADEPATELTHSQRMISACTGALLTSLLVTPFDGMYRDGMKCCVRGL